MPRGQSTRTRAPGGDIRYTVVDGAITELVATVEGADDPAKAFAG